MSGSELDPIFMKGLRLLHSKSKDSTEQLKQLLEEAIAQAKQSTLPKDRTYTSVKSDGENKIHIKKYSREAPDITGFKSKYPSEESTEKKTEKKAAEKTKQESIESEAKIPKLDPQTQAYPYYPSSPDIPKLDQYEKMKESDNSSDEKEDADDFAFEMGLACVICHSLDVTQGNQLIECQECHSLYHQECHRPPATDYDYNDPRRVWYCAKCIKNMKKLATKSQKTAKSSPTTTPKEIVLQAKPTKADNSPPALILPFKRAEPKTSISQNSQSSTNKPIGLAGLAANFGNRSTLASSSAASVTRGTKPATSKLASFSSLAATKTTSLATSAPKTISSSSTPSTSTQKTSTTTSTSKGLGLLSAAANTATLAASASAPRESSSAAAAAASSAAKAAAAGGNNSDGNGKPSCSPLMSADKRLQIMKKKASKMQERRRMSNK